MIITCPECSARFVLPEKALGSEGRTVRCGKCRHTWHKFPPQHNADDLKKLNASRVEARYQQAKAVKAAVSGEKTFLPALSVKTRTYHQWIVFSACFIWLVAAIVYLFGPRIINSYTFTRPIYKKIGITPTEDIRIYDTDIKKTKLYGRDAVALTGTIVNESESERYVPDLHILQKNSAGDVLDKTLLQSGFPVLKPGEETGYSDIVPLISQDVTEIVIDIGDAVTLRRRAKP